MVLRFTLALVVVATPCLAVDEEAALAFGKAIEAKIPGGTGPQAVTEGLDLDAFAARVFEGVNPTAEQRPKAMDAIRSAVPHLGNAVFGPRYRVHLLAYQAEKGRLLFRRVEPDTFALSYVCLYLAEVGGALRIVDAGQGEDLHSTALGRQLAAYLGGGGPSEAFFRVGQFWSRRQAKETLAEIAKLSPEEAKLSEILTIKLNAQAMEGLEAEWEQTYAQLVEAYPDSLEVKLAKFMRHHQRNEHEQALAAIDALGPLVEGDAYMDILRMLVHLEQGDRKAAAEARNRALKADPRIAEVFDNRAAATGVDTPQEAAVLFVGVIGGVHEPEVLDRFVDWPALRAATVEQNPELAEHSVSAFRELFLETFRGRQPKTTAAGLEKLRSGLQVEELAGVATVTGPGLRRPMRFHKVGERWVYRGN